MRNVVKCIECWAEFEDSFLRKKFDFKCCDACREPDGRHDLISKTEAKKQFGLTNGDFLRKPKLKYIVKPSANRFNSDIRLYLTLQVQQRAAEKEEYTEAMALAKELFRERRNVKKQQKVKRLQKQKQLRSLR